MCKKVFSCLFIILALIFVFSACTSLTAAKPVKLVFWIFLDPEGDDPRGKALKNVVTSFNESHPDIHVDVESIHWTKIDAQVIHATEAGAGPDLINIYTDQLAMHVAAGTVLPLNQYAEGWLKVHSEYFVPIDVVTFNGDIMALPWEIRVFLLWYRQDALKAAGQEPPKTLEELAAIGGKLREASEGAKIGLALSFSEKAYGACFMEFFSPLLWAHGGQTFDENGKPAFANDAGVATMQWFKDAVNIYGVIGREGLTLTADDVTNGFKAGTVLMGVEGSMRVAAVRSAEGVGNNLVTAHLPGLTPDKPSPCRIAGQTIAIGANTKNPEAAWEFIQYYLNMESQLEFAQAGVMPVLASAFDNPVIMGSPMGAEMKFWMEYAREYGHMEKLPADYNKLAELLTKASQEIVYKNAPIMETLEKVVADYEALR